MEGMSGSGAVWGGVGLRVFDWFGFRVSQDGWGRNGDWKVGMRNRSWLGWDEVEVVGW